MPTIISREKLDQAIREWQVRHKENLSYAELARRSGINILTLHRLKSGEVTSPDLSKLHAIAKVLECEVSDFIETIFTKEGDDLERERIAYQRDFDIEYQRTKEQTLVGTDQRIAAKFKGWILIEADPDNARLMILRPGGKRSNPDPDDVRILREGQAQEWLRQNPEARV
ncbi:MAG: helix-turn-helix transcriptional regulator [Anaerolineae bacterium]|nr:helix-turn-helix transcriptional regulator [Anaerolineae bacterium]